MSDAGRRNGRARRWNVHELPPQDGRTFLVTGGASGIGYFIAEQLAGTGATVILAGRDSARAELARQAIRTRVPGTRLRTFVLDLADLESVRKAADGLSASLGRLDGLILNAGLTAQPERRETVDGNELVFGTNHLGHFVLAASLYPLLARTTGSRIVTMGSVAARLADLDFDDLQAVRPPYKGFRTYGRSKLAQMVLASELDRRLRDTGSPVASVLAHPGGALDGLTPSRPPLHVRTATGFLGALPKAPVAQSKEHAAWPAVRAALDPLAEGGQLWGPRFLRGRGRPVREKPFAKMTDPQVGERLWSATERVAGMGWPLGDGG
ncbi:SDR family NAD(P)-dependent oxidoreductase [Streptomyces sp. NBC_01317]|uniref:SDR family NAD(P)-dependent oxidoreductase n=1 Tax=Streptomyces sp. NBC_01317 TaxID=2903822 RepID=UPI002E1133BD|nr:SDR family NAD(P)-dependent oxidoreductase [Streptomyces sp. NBC_01317]